ncbi:MAG: hypothetical protein JNK76_23310 [Planctomycetales bacterium]|nr:hypothetical protein [Planctomycetales bacterium]
MNQESIDESKLCIFCGKDESAGEMNVEHFVPRALWDKERPTSTKTAPAHVTCNKSFSDDNDYFRDVLVFEECENPHPEVVKLRNGTMKRKMEKRFGTIVKELKDLKERPVLTQSGIYLGTQPTFVIDTERMNRVLSNVVRGCFWQAAKRPFDPTTIIQVHDEKRMRHPALQAVIQGLPGDWNSFGDDVFGCRYRSCPELHEDFFVCLMVFYKRRHYLGVTAPKEVRDRISNEEGLPRI